MITDNLFEQVLVDPFEPNSTLYIVSGYASATMVSRHFNRLVGDGRRRAGFIRRQDLRIELIVGMAAHDGISQKDHEGFQEISREYSGLFVCRYVAYSPPVHSKTFAWYSDDVPKVGFTGSANYTQRAFGNLQREAVIEHDAESARNYFDIIRQYTIDCSDPHVTSLVTVYSEPGYSMRLNVEDAEELEDDESIPGIDAEDLAQLPHKIISFLDRQGNLPQQSGLNWSFRTGYVRNDRNQAYIRIPAHIANTDFFPPVGDHFTIITDDNINLICSRAQQNAKAIHTPHSNSIMGRYFRHRMNLPLSKQISTNDIRNYGRTDVDFYKIDDETYYMDFSV